MIFMKKLRSLVHVCCGSELHNSGVRRKLTALYSLLIKDRRWSMRCTAGGTAHASQSSLNLTTLSWTPKFVASLRLIRCYWCLNDVYYRNYLTPLSENFNVKHLTHRSRFYVRVVTYFHDLHCLQLTRLCDDASPYASAFVTLSPFC